MEQAYDRATEDLGNAVHLEHVNVSIPDQRLATLFYVTGLGLTRDPYLMTSVDNMWINVGRSQFHMPTGKPRVLRGRIGLVIPDREWLLGRLASVREALAGTCFAFAEHNAFIEAVCPWGNRLRIHEPDARFGGIALGMPYVEFDVPLGTAEGIVRFYRQILGAHAALDADEQGRVARASVGVKQWLVYRETERTLPDYDGHHIQIYVADFSGPHRRLKERGLVTEESDRWQYRFEALVDPENGAPLFTIEHEVRSMTHPLYGRPLTNCNPYQSNRRFAAGHEERAWALTDGA